MQRHACDQRCGVHISLLVHGILRSIFLAGCNGVLVISGALYTSRLSVTNPRVVHISPLPPGRMDLTDAIVKGEVDTEEP